MATKPPNPDRGPSEVGRFPTPRHIVEKCIANAGQYVKVWIRTGSRYLGRRGRIIEGQIMDPKRKRGERNDTSLVIKQWGKQLAPLNRRGRPNGSVITVKYASILKIQYKWDDTEEVVYPVLFNSMEFI